MAARDFFDHDTPEEFSASGRVGLLARDFAGLSAENITFGQDLPAKVTALDWFKYWTDSPDHRRNLLRPEFGHAGHALVVAGNRQYAVGLYGWQATRIVRPPPLRLTSAGSLVEAMDQAAPRIERFQISEPAGEDDGRAEPYVIDEGGPLELSPGAWRLRPFLPAGGRRTYPVVWGPIFVVGERG